MNASSVKALLVGAFTVVAGVILTWVKPGKVTPSSAPTSQPVPAREAVARAALGQLGNGDPQRYWDDVLPGVNVGRADWCGAGALWCLHQAGLALDRRWAIGSGFLLTPPALPMTKQPEVGDIAYFDQNEHHAVVVAVAPCAVSLVSFNGANGLVSESSIEPSRVTAFFSIAPLIANANA